jgi:hypothetical protein
MSDHETVATAALRAALAAVKDNQSELARICGCTQGAVWQMLNRNPPRLSYKYVLKVEAATGVPRYLLRPDIYPRPAQSAVNAE